MANTTVFLVVTEDPYGGDIEDRKVFLTLDDARTHAKQILTDKQNRVDVIIQEFSFPFETVSQSWFHEI